MKTKLLLVGAAVVAVLGAGSAIAWGASSQPGPAVWSHDVVTGATQPGPGMTAMHRGLDQADLDEMGKACQKEMKNGGMTEGDAGMMGDDGGMMGDDGGMMGG